MTPETITHEAQISDLTKQYSGQGITFEQFQEVVKTCKSQNQSPTDEVSIMLY